MERRYDGDLEGTSQIPYIKQIETRFWKIHENIGLNTIKIGGKIIEKM